MYDHYYERLAYFRSGAKDSVDVLFLGDSLTERYDVGSYFPVLKTCNRGIDGDTPLGLLERLDDSLVPAKTVVLLIGVNDLSSVESVYPLLLDQLKKRSEKSSILVLSILPLEGSYARDNLKVIQANSFIASLCKEEQLPFLDIHDRFYGEKKELDPSYSIDGCHLTAEGYELLTRLIVLEIEGSLRRC